KMDNPNEYDKAKLLSIIPKIRPYTRYEEKGLLTVLQALFNIGVTVIVQSYLSKTQVRGGTFVVNGKPCIAITDYNKSYATLWFALLHELYHVLYDLEELKTLSYHLTGEEQSDIYLFKEELADYFACEMLFPQENLNYIQHSIQSPMLVAAYGEKMKVHPSIIYSFYCYEQNKLGKNCYALYNQYFGNPDKALKMVKTNPWNKESIYMEIEKARKILIPTTA
ncbi:MAG: transporter, partial [Hymenobacter sp.]